MTRLNILFVGDGGRAEFRDARASLNALGRVTPFSDPQRAAAALTAGRSPPDAIVVAQSYPGQFSAEEMDRLRQMAPLARIIALLGSWCEGEQRSGKPWPALRVYWHQWPARSARQLRRLLESPGPTWALPLTATDEERLLAEAAEPWPERRGLIVVNAVTVQAEEWLCDACAARGYATVGWLGWRPTRVQGATAAIFDGAGFQDEERDRLAWFSATLRPAPVIALADFPRIEDRQRILAAGAAAMLSKPVTVEDLWWQIEALRPANE
jgi:CheY-like chemotaxis protein